MKILESGVTVHADGNARRESVLVECVDDERPKADDVAALHGYHPAGYGAWNIEVLPVEGRPRVWRVRWTRAASCD